MAVAVNQTSVARVVEPCLEQQPWGFVSSSRSRMTLVYVDIIAKCLRLLITPQNN
ncbi:hypothetical protein NC652_038297 [Populus alba x Populus x berolinensis]|uniref:Uncharacterized protein n=1 Tax=Populus alba x Populus x berolinensis TaxID=444605 RepID=A0AAD6PUN9_9ROSI|nr:hypothetical protein NC652_038297 [Populus alba x Populus x berolinensis]KAJ6960237.1 hypothetical protein NC653_038314 [Populus alba x Populus x berolinensis]